MIAVASPLFVSNSVTILGPGPTSLTITRTNGSPLNGLFYITSNHVVTIAGLALANGNAAGLFGGAIYNNHSTLTVSNCFIGGNSAADGGGIYNDGADSGSATLHVIASTLDGNVAVEAGGGIYNDGQDSGSATLNIVASTLSRNSTTLGSGGAIFNLARSGSATVNVTGSTLSTNHAGYDGGGITTIGSPPIVGPDDPPVMVPPVSIRNSTLNGNSAPLGDSIATFGPAVGLASTILSAGSSGTNVYLSGGSVTSEGYNLYSDDGSGVVTNLTDQINTPPRLGPLAHNGGPTLTHAPMCDSPAIDQGRNFAGTATDQRGAQRTYDFATYPNPAGGDGTDIGAVEAPIWVFSVLNTADSGAGSLREAISNANASAGIDFIEFDPGAYGMITLTNGELSITDCLFVYGPGPTNVAVNGNYPNTTNRVFQVGPPWHQRDYCRANHHQWLRSPGLRP
jgi:hypothetical protein